MKVTACAELYSAIKMQDKKTIRSICREIRGAVKDAELKSIAAAENILSFNKIISADTVLLYASIGSETKTDLLIKNLLANGKKVALPRCSDNGFMTFYCISSITDLINGKYNIPEPASFCQEAEITHNTVCIVPGLAFTNSGARLGYGGGYYDRFTAANPGIYTIGLTFEELILSELPVLPHDLTVNAIATEERMVLCCAE